MFLGSARVAALRRIGTLPPSEAKAALVGGAGGWLWVGGESRAFCGGGRTSLTHALSSATLNTHTAPLRFAQPKRPAPHQIARAGGGEAGAGARAGGVGASG
eukprot:6628339-Prymnesium_polylepis.2